MTDLNAPSATDPALPTICKAKLGVFMQELQSEVFLIESAIECAQSCIWSTEWHNVASELLLTAGKRLSALNNSLDAVTWPGEVQE